MEKDRASLAIIVHPRATVTPKAFGALFDTLSQLMGRPMPVQTPDAPVGADELRGIIAGALQVFPSTARSLVDRKWRREGQNIPSERRAETPTLSGNMIVKDGVSRGSDVERAVLSVAPICSELVIVDTGSEDGTLEKLEELRPRLPCELHVHSVGWEYSFAEARNACIERSSGDYWLWIDADEEYTDEARHYILEAFDADSGRRQTDELFGYNLQLIGYGIPGELWRMRVVPRLESIRWQYALHEQIDDDLAKLGVEQLRLPASIMHHSFIDPEHIDANNQRDNDVAAFHEDPELVERGWHGNADSMAIGITEAGDVIMATSKQHTRESDAWDKLGELVGTDGDTLTPSDVFERRFNAAPDEGAIQGPGSPLDLNVDLSDLQNTRVGGE